jgi:16S rRNA (cytosine967-C5)-methyltransferase
LLRKAPPPIVRHILRLAIAEYYAEGAPSHAVVNWAVGAVRGLPRQGHLAGMVNAVLRRALETSPEAWGAMAVPMLPRWLRQPLVGAWGRTAVAGIEAAHLAGARVDLTLRAPDDDLATELGAEVLPAGSLRLPMGIGRISALPGFDAGAWWVQDAGAALPARLLAPEKGARVVDLCAAPGGKTLQLAAMGADVTALDISAPRLARLAENLARTGLTAQVVAADALHWTPETPPDAVLLDAPCSASGTIRRHPDLPHVKDEGALPSLLALQAALIDRALGWLRPGGVLVYCTCSLLPDEGEAQALAALARHPGLRAEAGDLPGADPAWQSVEGGWRLRPDFWADRGGIDGFYMIRLRKAEA